MPGFNRHFEGDFFQSQNQHPDWPIVISEGDSWFDYPFERNVIDWLDDPSDAGNQTKQTPWSLLRLEHSGEEILNILSGTQRAMIRGLLGKYPIQAILFSGGGNDIIGADLLPLLKPFDPSMTTGEDCLVTARLQRRLEQIRDCYLELIDLCADAGRGTLIYAHGYDYVIPSPVGVKLFGGNIVGPWMLPYMKSRGILDAGLQIKTARALIDQFNQMMLGLAQAHPSFHYIDTRGRVGTDWLNEIHANHRGSQRVAGAFAEVLRGKFPSLDFTGI